MKDEQSEIIDLDNVNLDTWRELYHRARELNVLAPWGWMKEMEFFALHDEQTGEPRVVSVQAGDGKTRGPGVCFYRGQEGIRFVMNVLQDQLDIDYLYPAMHQSCVFVSFFYKTDLWPAERRLIKRLQFVPAGANRQAFPQFVSTIPEFVPAPPNQQEAETLIGDLRKTFYLAELCREHPGYDEERLINEFPFYPRNPREIGPLKPEDLEWNVMDYPLAEVSPPYQLDSSTKSALNAYPQAAGVTWELGCIYWPGDRVERSRLRYDAWAAVADQDSAQVITGDRVKPDETVQAALARCLASAINSKGTRPKAVEVARASLVPLLATFKEDLGIRVDFNAQLPVLQQGKENLVAHLDS